MEPFDVWDSVYGKHKLPHICGLIVRSLEFQRLRDISVMGPVVWVFPSATHSMYEHSIGAAVLANMWATSLHARFPQAVSARDVLTVSVAALLSQVGCMPWEYVFRNFVAAHGEKRTMRQASAKIASLIFERPALQRACLASGIDAAVVQDVILGAQPESDQTRLFLYDLVHASAGPDAVSVDFLMRCDARLGLKYGLDVHNLISNSWVGVSSHVVVNALTLATLSHLERHINRLVLCNAEVAAISVAMQSVWQRCEWIHQVSDDMPMLLRMSDVTFRTPEFVFFYNDMLARRFPKMTAETEFARECDAHTFMSDNPLTSGVYHMSKLKQFSSFSYIVRVFI